MNVLSWCKWLSVFVVLWSLTVIPTTPYGPLPLNAWFFLAGFFGVFLFCTLEIVHYVSRRRANLTNRGNP